MIDPNTHRRVLLALNHRFRKGLEWGVALGFVVGVSLTLVSIFVWEWVR